MCAGPLYELGYGMGSPETGIKNAFVSSYGIWDMQEQGVLFTTDNFFSNSSINLNTEQYSIV